MLYLQSNNPIIIMKKITQIAICSLILSSLSVSCTGLTDANTIHSSSLGRPGTSYPAVIVATQAIEVAASNTAKTASAAVGAVAGGLAGSLLGGGSAKTYTTGGGAILGGLAGMGVASQVGKTRAQRITMQVEGKKNYITIDQTVTKDFGDLYEGQQGVYTEVPGGQSYFRPYSR